jgi:hypothetical protein
MRRAIDPLWAILCLTFFAPFILLIAVLIKLDSPGLVLYVPQNELEIEYHQKRSLSLDLRLTLQFLGGLITSRGKSKARGASDRELEGPLDDRSH